MSDAAVLGRRLERLRLCGSGTRPAVAAPPAARAGPLATELGGSVVGSIVVFESAADIAVDRSLFARLPFPVSADRPLVLLDTETTGLATGAGTLPFLVGIGTWIGDRLVVRQFLVPDHADEPDLLGLLAAAVPPDACLVTYNGRSFDWPLLVARYRLHRRDPPEPAGQLDLLHVARRLWKYRLGNARLATVESAVCGVARHDDLPGALIPERYFAFLRHRRADVLRPVLAHNRQDVVSLGLLVATLASMADAATWAELHPGDLGMLGRAHARNGEDDRALTAFEGALSSPAWQRGVVSGSAVWRRLVLERARILARCGRREEALTAWLELARRGGPGAAAAWLHVARHREHVERDYAEALAACQEALAVAERARLWGRAVPSVERDLAVRMARLRRKQGPAVQAPKSSRLTQLHVGELPARSLRT